MRTTVDGNEAAASAAYRLNEVCCIYPITPSSPMAELADEWASQGRKNVWGSVPSVVEMQSEGGAAGALHGALQGGALTTTFTASQGLLLMIPNMYKIAGELTPAVFHVAARSLAAQALSIFGDHSDVMAIRQTGFALLASASVQEAHDLAVVAQAATLRTRIPFVHFFDGFRTSHELNTVELLSDDDLLALVPSELIRDHRGRALSPERPVIRGTAQNPDVYFQARETVNPFYARVPSAVQDAMDALAERTGRRYSLAEYHGAPDAERVIVAMGSGAQTAAETAVHLVAQGEKVGVVQLRLYRPFPTAELLAVIPASARRVAVLDRTKEPGALGEPLFLDVIAGLAEALSAGTRETMPLVIGGRYGLSSKELTPAMVAGIFTELSAERPRSRFTIGINDDVSGISLPWDRTLDIESPRTLRAVFFGMGSDGTVGANKNTIKILGEDPGRHAQGYFVYDSKKSGSETVSHLRFGPDPIRAPYLIDQAGFVGCHHPRLIERPEVLERAAPGATFLLNTSVPPAEVWDSLPREAQEQLLAKRITLYTIDAGRVAREAGLAGRVNTVLQTCFFAISGVLPQDQAIAEIKHAITKSYARRGPQVIAQNEAAVDASVAALHRVELPATVTATRGIRPVVPADAPEFVRNVTGAMMAGHGEDLPVSALPVDGTYPSGTAAYEKRNISDEVAVWDPNLCIQCGNCSFVCPHSVIRSKLYDSAQLAGAPDEYVSMPLNSRGLPDSRFTLMVYLEDCTGCGLCVEACPVASPADPKHKAINLAEREPRVAAERRNIAFFESLPIADRSRVDFGTVRGTQYLQPLFEFSGACAGCGETPYLKLLSQLFGDRLMIANATGCSSIYGGNLPTTPWTSDAAGRGPAWSNSLFEDNAEFGLGFRLAADQQLRVARERLGELREAVGGSSSTRSSAPPSAGSPSTRPSVNGSTSCAGAWTPWEMEAAPRPPTCAASWTSWCAAASGSSAVTAGPTTSAPAVWITCWQAVATSTCSCSTPRSTPTPAARRRSPHRSAPSPSSPRRASGSARRTSPSRRSPTATSTSPGWRWARTPSRPSGRCARRRPTTARRWSSPTAIASPTGSRRTACCCATAWTSSTGPSPAGTGRSSATTRWCAAMGATPSSSTHPGRAWRSASTQAGSSATGALPAPTRPRRRSWSSSPRRRSTGAGRPTRRWPPTAPTGSR